MAVCVCVCVFDNSLDATVFMAMYFAQYNIFLIIPNDDTIQNRIEQCRLVWMKCDRCNWIAANRMRFDQCLVIEIDNKYYC